MKNKKIRTVVMVATLAVVSIFAGVKMYHSVNADKPAMAEPGGGDSK